MSLKERFDLVIFDWAGTMVDFGCAAPVKALLDVFAEEGVKIDSLSVRRDMGKSKIDHLRRLLSYPEIAKAWRGRHGRAANDRDVELLMARLGPSMREHAARASELIPGARQTFEQLRQLGVRVASSTGYTREMMQPLLARAAEQGYRPEHLVCSGETPVGRPAPLMIYKACAELGVWPLSRVVKVDDAEVGIAEGKAAGAFTIGVASGNSLALDLAALDAASIQSGAIPAANLEAARAALHAAGADLVLDSVADLVPMLERAVTLGSAPPHPRARP